MNRIGRRKFCSITGSRALSIALTVAVAGSETFLLTGCAVTLDDVISWTNIGGTAVGSVMTFLTAAGIVCAVCGIAATAAVAAIHAIADAIRLWQQAAPADKATLWDKIQLAMNLAVTEAGNFFKEINMPLGSLATMIMGIASLAISTIVGFIKKFFPAKASAARNIAFRLGAAPIPVTPKELSSADFKKQYNKIVTAGGHTEAVIQ